MKGGLNMAVFYNTIKEKVSVAKVFVVSKTIDLKNDIYGFGINVECYDVFLNNFIKKEIEKISALVLSYAPELQVYKHIKEKAPILEFMVSKYPNGDYKIDVSSPFEEYILKKKSYYHLLSIISKSLIERIKYLFGTVILDG